jgi:CDGSH-type Zn-finger protein
LHFAECVRGLHSVFDTNARPWIQPDNAAVDLVAEVVRRCPTGALHYELTDGPNEAQPTPTRVTAVEDGPLLLRGDVLLSTPAGELRDVRAALCRCGLTANQPFCDDGCKRAGWHSPPAEPSPGRSD